MSERRHLFISHRFADDKAVESISSMLAKHGWDARNSSVRAKQANLDRIARGEIPERTLKRLLRMKITWAQTVVVVIGKTTHESTWVDYEIREANRQGKRIVGVYARGETEAKLPPALEKYANAIIAWNTNSITDAIDGGQNRFELPNGSTRLPSNAMPRKNC